MKFKFTEYIKEFVKVKEEYDYVEVRKNYECSTYDDLQSLFLTLVDFSSGKLKFEVEKIEEVEVNG